MSSDSTDNDMMPPMHRAPAAHIDDVRIEDEMSKAYVDYGMSVIVSRALPDVRDGLKPVHRRILYAMDEEGLTASRSHTKSSKIVGSTMGNYHPHGDSAIYDTLVGMSQPFSMRYPLVDGQGNFGSLDGDSAAAMRYTEARMESFGEEMLRDLGENTVDWQANYDDRLEEPTVLPSAVPNLLLNGSTGIAVGMSTKIPPHNLREIVDALTELIDNPDATVDDLMEHVSGPDFPTGATIVGFGGIEKAYKTGRGKLRVRAQYEVNEDDRQIVITEVPYQKNKSKLVEDIAHKVNNDVIEGVRDLRDESDQHGVRIVVELKKDAIPSVVENQLIDEVLEETFGVINLALVDGEPKVLTLKEMLSHYLDHRREIVTRRSQYRLDEAEHHAHILEGRLVAVENADSIVELIRDSDDRDDAISRLQVEFDFSEEQATHVVRMQLGSLTSIEAGDIKTEYDETKQKISELTTLLNNESILLDTIKEELAEIRSKYGDDRRTNIIADDGSIDREDLIPEENIVVVMTDAGYLKRMTVDTFKTQSRGGKGVIGTNLRDEDTVNAVFTASTHDRFLAFTNEGNVYSLKGYEVPEAGRNARGTAAVNIIDLSADERLVALRPESEMATDTPEDTYLVTFTKDGYVKRTSMTEYASIQTNGKRALTLNDGDQLVDVAITNGECDLLMSSKQGMSIRFSEADVRSVGRTARGVNGIKLAADDAVIGAAVIPENSEGCGLLTVTKNGYGKRTDFGRYRTQSRYGKGVIDIKTGDRNGAVAQATTICETDDILIMTTKGQIMRTNAQDISEVGRNTKGVRLMKLSSGDSVQSISTIPAE